MSLNRVLSACFLTFGLGGVVFADVELPKVFTSHMVLQRDRAVAMWGWADPGEEVTVKFAGQSTTAQTDSRGRWRLTLKPMAASAESRTLSVQGRNRITLADVLVGDVWLASGQSNMNRPVGAKAIEGAAHPNLRLFTTNGKIPRQERLNDTVGWVICTPQTIATCGDIVGKNGRRRPFSEVAYEFSRRVHRKTGTPVGIIHTSMGGSTAKDWTPNPDIAMQHPFDQDHGDVRHKWGIVYQSRLRGLVPYTLRGVVWYQGEDDGRNRRYGEELEAMILKWRRLWSDPDLPFYMAQIAQTTYAGGMLSVWEAQQRVAAKLPHTGIAPSNDLMDAGQPDRLKREKNTGWPIAGGGNPHPPNKAIVANRLADIALARTYGLLEREVFGPTYASHRFEGNKCLVVFKYVGKGLTVQGNLPLTWFELSADGRTFVKAKAKIVDQSTVELVADDLHAPRLVRFAWHPLARHNLYNREGLPAHPFRTR